MTVGDFRPAPSIGAVHGPTNDDLQYQLGFAAGYRARVREETEDYLRVVEAGRQVYDRTVRSLVNLPTIAELRAARVAVLKEGHEAGFHTGDVRSPDCPYCVQLERDDPSNRHHSGHYGVPPCTCDEPSGMSGCEQHMPVKLAKTISDFRCTTHGMRGCPSC